MGEWRTGPAVSPQKGEVCCVDADNTNLLVSYLVSHRPPIAEVIDVHYNLTFSLVVLAAWVLGLMALTALLFQRQDITS